MIRFRRVLAVALASTAVLAACGNDDDASSDAGGAEVAVISPYYGSQPATKEVVDAFVSLAEANGHTVTVVDTNNDLSKVNSEMETAVSRGVDAIVLGMGDPQEFGAGLAATREAGVPVVGLDAGTAPGVTANVTSDNTFLGEASAQAIIDAVGEGGTVAIIHFDPFEPVRLRAAAARPLFEAAGFTIVEDTQGDPADSTGFAKKTVLDWLVKYPEGELDAIWVAWDASALGAYQATEEAGRTEVLVTGVDGQDFARAEVRKGGNWIVTVRQDWAGIAAKALETVEGILGGQINNVDSLVLTVPGEVLDKDNA